MNQILAVEMDKKKKKNSEPVEIKKVVTFFAVVILIFGLACIGKGSYAIVTQMGLLTNNQIQKPTIDLVKQGEDKITVKVTYEKELVRLVYKWDDGEEQEIAGNGSNTIEGTIDLPTGNHHLTLTVYDIQGAKTTYEKDYVVDANKPELSIGQENGKVKIVAKDMVALSYITYRWDDGEEETVYAQEDSKAQIELSIDTPVGEHTLTVVAVNSNNITETKTLPVVGATKPTINATTNQDQLILTVTDENNVNFIEFTYNGQQYQIDYREQPSPKIEWSMPLQPGDNHILIKAYNIYNIESTFEGIAPYNP